MRPQHVPGPFGWAEAVDYPQAVVAGGLVFVSGQYAADEAGDVLQVGFREQARATFANLGAVLASAGTTFANLVHLRTFLRDPGDFATYKEVRREFLHPPFPATLAVCVAEFTYPGMLIEMEAVAQHPAVNLLEKA